MNATENEFKNAVKTLIHLCDPFVTQAVGGDRYEQWSSISVAK